MQVHVVSRWQGLADRRIDRQTTDIAKSHREPVSKIPNSMSVCHCFSGKRDSPPTHKAMQHRSTQIIQIDVIIIRAQCKQRRRDLIEGIANTATPSIHQIEQANANKDRLR